MLTFAKNLLVIDFNFIDVPPIENDTPLLDWLLKVAESEGYSVAALSYIFCNDQYLLGSINLIYHTTLSQTLLPLIMWRAPLFQEIYLSP